MDKLDFAFHAPLGSVSFGQVSYAILRELYQRELEPCIFPINEQIDHSAQTNINKDFLSWIESCRKKALFHHNRKNPTFKLWHFVESLQSYSEKQALLTFYELDQPTDFEVNVAKNNSLIVTSKYTQDTFKDKGVDSNLVHLGFDKYNFNNTNKTYFEDRITFNVVGKFEKRKHHARIIKAWLKEFGNNTNYQLQCAIDNPFFKQEQNVNVRKQLLGGVNYHNVQFVDFFPTNYMYNDFLNSADIVIGMSGGEGWGLPEFHSVALGKHAVILNATSYKEWANEENSVLVHPCGKWPAEDGIFFKKGTLNNQGNIYTFSEEEYIEGCKEAIKRVESNRVNEPGLKLKSQFTYTNTCDSILEILKQL